MANNCWFDMKIVGEKKNVEEFIRMLKWKGPYERNGLGRVFSFDIDPSLSEPDPRGGQLVSVQGFGDCAWSIKTAMQDWERRPLLQETTRLGLVVEIYSSEPGIGFQEHLLINGNEILIEDCVDYEEHWLDGAEESEIAELAEEKGMTVAELKSKINCNGDYCEGGFDTYCDFEDLFSYVEPLHAKYKVELKSCGNPDHEENPFVQYEDAVPYVVAVGSIEEAQTAVMNYIEDYNLGGGNWAGGNVWTSEGEYVGRISYNGRFWDKTHEYGKPDTSLDEKIQDAKKRVEAGRAEPRKQDHEQER